MLAGMFILDCSTTKQKPQGPCDHELFFPSETEIYTIILEMGWSEESPLLFESRAYDKAAIKQNGREAVTNFEPSAYQRETLLDSNNGGIKLIH